MVLLKTSKIKIKSIIFPRKRQIYKLLQKALALVEAIAGVLPIVLAAALLQAVLMSAGSQVALAPALGIQI